MSNLKSFTKRFIKEQSTQSDPIQTKSVGISHFEEKIEVSVGISENQEERQKEAKNSTSSQNSQELLLFLIDIYPIMSK